MMEALAAAAILGGLNTIGDYATAVLELQSRPLYALARAAVIGYCLGGIVGARARQIFIGAISGLLIGIFVGIGYQALTPSLGWRALLVAAPVFWIGFSFLETVLHGDSTAAAALLRGLAAAAVSGLVFYVIASAWPEPKPNDPNLARLLVVWIGGFFPGFLLLFWKRL